MGGLFIDVLIAYLIKSVRRLRRLSGSNGWERVEGRVRSARLGGGWFWNCPTADVVYTYEFGGQPYSSLDSTPFLFTASAKDQLQRYRTGEGAIIRVNPIEPQSSVLEPVDR